MIDLGTVEVDRVIDLAILGVETLLHFRWSSGLPSSGKSASRLPAKLIEAPLRDSTIGIGDRSAVAILVIAILCHRMNIRSSADRIIHFFLQITETMRPKLS